MIGTPVGRAVRKRYPELSLDVRGGGEGPAGFKGEGVAGRAREGMAERKRGDSGPRPPSQHPGEVSAVEKNHPRRMTGESGGAGWPGTLFNPFMPGRQWARCPGRESRS